MWSNRAGDPIRTEAPKARGEKRGGITGLLATRWSSGLEVREILEAPKWGFSHQQKAKVLLLLDAKANPWEYNKYKSEVKRIVANLASVAKVVMYLGFKPQGQGIESHQRQAVSNGDRKSH